MKRIIGLLAAWFAISALAMANQPFNGICQAPAAVSTATVSSSNNAMIPYPQCTVTVYLHNTTTPATLYSDNNNSSLGNPFTAQNGPRFFFYASNGRYDYTMSGGGNGGFPSPVSVADVIVFDASQFQSSYLALPFSSTLNFDAQYDSAFAVTLTGNVTASQVVHAAAGQFIFVSICQNATGGFTFAWPPNFTNPPPVGTGPNACLNGYFLYNGSNWLFVSSNSAAAVVPGGSTGSVISNQGNSFYGDTNLTYNPTTKTLASTGYFEASMLDCGGEVFNVTCPQFAGGADSTGTNDSTPAIVAAGNAACAKGGGTIYFPPGTYLHTQLQAPCGNLNYLGPVVGSAHLKDTSTGATFGLWFNGVNNVKVENLEIDGNNAGGTVVASALTFGNVKNGWAVNNLIHNGGATNLGVDSPNGAGGGSSNINITGNVLGASGQESLNTANLEIANGLVNYVLVENNEIAETTTGQTPVDINGANYVTFVGNRVTGLGSSFACVQLETGSGITQNVLVNSNILTGCQNGLYNGTGGQTTGKPLQHIVEMGNHLVNNGNGIQFTTFNGISSNPLLDINFSGNVITGSTASGIAMANNSGATWSGVVISNNLIDGYGLGCSPPSVNAGIVVCNFGITGVTIANNTVSGSGYGYADARTSVSQGTVELQNNHLQNNTLGNFRPGVNASILSPGTFAPAFKFTPNSATFTQTYGFPFAPAVYLVTVETLVATGPNYSSQEWTGIAWVNNTNAGSETVKVQQLSNLGPNNGITVSLTVTGAINNAIQIQVSNSSGVYAPVFVYSQLLGYNGTSSQ